MEKFLTVGKGTASEKEIEKSRFLTYSAHVESEEEARSFVSSIRALHPSATHVVYAFVADKTGALLRFSDDGEPQGTAGMPVLEVIRAKKLYETAVAVVRYFGGIKLGAGGLVRAYSACAAENLAAADIRVRQMGSELAVCVGYSEITPLLKFLEENGVTLSSSYGAEAEFLVAVKREEEAAFIASLTDRLAGRVRIQKKREYFFSFEE